MDNDLTPEQAAEQVLFSTKKLTKPELVAIMGSVYNRGYDEGRARGYEMAEVDNALDNDYHFEQGYNIGRSECP